MTNPFDRLHVGPAATPVDRAVPAAPAAEATLARGTLPAWLGSGNGDGYGDGSGYGYGYGNGNGYGYGDGYGNGDGYGDGDDYGAYWASTIQHFAAKWPAPQRRRLAELQAAGVKVAFWRSDANGQPANNGTPMEPAAPGVVHTAPGPLNLCKRGTLHATLLPPEWQGSRWWIVALHGEVVGDDEKFGCLKREIVGECL